MKNLIYALILMIIPSASNAADYSFIQDGGGNKSIVGYLANESGLAYDRNYYLNIGQFSGNKISASVVYTSATFSNVTFTTTTFSTTTWAGITSASHGYTDGLPVLLRATDGTVPSPLIAETTYYIYEYSANVIYLATTSAQAVAADPITLLTYGTGATRTYTLIPLSITGTPSFKWQASNDGSNFFDVDITSITISEYTYGGAKVGFDFDDFNYTILKLKATAPTAGGISLKAKINIKQ